jgi:hypothetical protein
LAVLKTIGEIIPDISMASCYTYLYILKGR